MGVEGVTKRVPYHCRADVWISPAQSASMASEAQRGLILIGSNYARLASTLVFGIALVPLLASWLGADALGLFLFLMAQAGMAAIFQEEWASWSTLWRRCGLAVEGVFMPSERMV